MSFLLPRIRLVIYLITLALIISIYIGVVSTVPQGSTQTIRLTQLYALSAVTYLYLALLASPLYSAFPYLPIRALHVKARRAIGVSAFTFALLHGSIAFFLQLGGFRGLGFLTERYLLAITLSFTALCILFLMAATSFNSMVRRLGKWWKRLHRLVYVAGILITIHALMLGSHFVDISTTIPQIFFSALAILLILEALRIDQWLSKKMVALPQFGLALTITLISIGILSYLYFNPVNGKPLGFGIHAEHIRLAQEANKTSGKPNVAARRFTTSFIHQEDILPNQETPLTFEVFDATSGNKVNLFGKVYDKLAHLIIVDEELNYFTHIHPEQTKRGFEIATTFPHAGEYHLYIDYLPYKEKLEQQFGFTLTVGESKPVETTPAKPNYTKKKTFGEYEVTLKTPNPLWAEYMSQGKQTLTFTIKDRESKKPITRLKPYLASFGHLVMINQETFDYLHVHPTRINPPPDANGGPDVTFLPLGLYGPIKPGVYRVFAQFNPDGKLFTADFSVEVK